MTTSPDPENAPRTRPNILVTGTPGTGKTTTASLIADAAGFEHIDVGALVKKEGLHTGSDKKFDALIIDEDKVVDALEDALSSGGCVVDYHGCDFFPERWFDLVVVLQTDTSVLWDRLSGPERNYSQDKVAENVQCEIMHVCVEEARESYKEEIVRVIPSNTVEEMEANVDLVVEWAAAFEREAPARMNGKKGARRSSSEESDDEDEEQDG